MATKLARKDVPTPWSAYLSVGTPTGPSAMGRGDPVERQRRIAQLRELVASGRYEVNLEQLGAALIRRGGLTHGAEARAAN